MPTANSQAGTLQPPVSPMANLNLQNGQNGHNNYNDEKQGNSYYQPSPSPQPPSYAPPPQASYPPLAQATALYAYSSTDAGDLELQSNDHITVTEYMNAEWVRTPESPGMEAKTDHDMNFSGRASPLALAKKVSSRDHTSRSSRTKRRLATTMATLLSLYLAW